MMICDQLFQTPQNQTAFARTAFIMNPYFTDCLYNRLYYEFVLLIPYCTYNRLYQSVWMNLYFTFLIVHRIDKRHDGVSCCLLCTHICSPPVIDIRVIDIHLFDIDIPFWSHWHCDLMESKRRSFRQMALKMRHCSSDKEGRGEN